MSGQGPDLDNRDPNSLNSHVQVWIILVVKYFFKMVKLQIIQIS
jgi:hypothetical protein